MSVENNKVIDSLGVDRKNNEVVLAISDHLPWTAEDTIHHLNMLQDKLNTYLAFIESGELLERYPDAKELQPVIRIYGAYEMNAAAIEYFERAKRTVLQAGYDLRFKHLVPQEDC